MRSFPPTVKKYIPHFKKVMIGIGAFLMLIIIYAIWRMFFDRRPLGFYR